MKKLDLYDWILIGLALSLIAFGTIFGGWMGFLAALFIVFFFGGMFIPNKKKKR